MSEYIPLFRMGYYGKIFTPVLGKLVMTSYSSLTRFCILNTIYTPLWLYFQYDDFMTFDTLIPIMFRLLTTLIMQFFIMTSQLIKMIHQSVCKDRQYELFGESHNCRFPSV